MHSHPWCERALYDPSLLLAKAAAIKDAIATFPHPLNAIAASGISGIGMAAVVSALSGIPMLTVRKARDDVQNSVASTVQGPEIEIANYCIVDDLISSGGTVARIRELLAPAQCLCILLYDGNSWRRKEYARAANMDEAAIYLV